MTSERIDRAGGLTTIYQIEDVAELWDTQDELARADWRTEEQQHDDRAASDAGEPL